MTLDVKAGDTVIVYGMWGRKRISTVQKVTPTGKIRVDNNLYSATGVRHVNTFEVEYLEIATPEKVKAIRDRYTILKAITICHEIDIEDLTVEKAEKIIAILRKEDEEKHNVLLQKR